VSRSAKVRKAASPRLPQWTLCLVVHVVIQSILAAETGLKSRLKQASNRRGQPRNELKTLETDLGGRNRLDFRTVRPRVQIPGPRPDFEFRAHVSHIANTNISGRAEILADSNESPLRKISKRRPAACAIAPAMRKVSPAVCRIEERTSRRYSGRPARRRASPSSAFLSGFAKRADRIAMETVRDGSSSRTRSATTLASSPWPRLASAAACKT
jgi:hypothetical protein